MAVHRLLVYLPLKIVKHILIQDTKIIAETDGGYIHAINVSAFSKSSQGHLFSGDARWLKAYSFYADIYVTKRLTAA